MLNKNNILRFLIVVLFLSTIAIATETTWRHSGFEISGFDMNGSSTYNLTEIRKIEFGWNTSIPAVSETSRAVMYYDDNQKRIMQSVNGGAYQAIVDNTTVNFVTGNASNLTTGVVPNASAPNSSANISKANTFTELQTFNGGLNMTEYNVTAPTYFYYSNSTNSAALSAGVFVRVTFPNATSDTKSLWNGTSLNVKVSGWYIINTALRVGTLAANDFALLSFYKNGTQFHRVEAYYAPVGARPILKGNNLFQLNAGDVIEVFVYSSGTGQTIEAGSNNDYYFIEGYKIG